MIFVTVGTHEQQFNRLIEAVDQLVEGGRITDKVFAQVGYCTYEPRHFESAALLPYQEMQEYLRNADVVVSHGGPSTFMAALAYGKVPVVVPRKEEFAEHVNDHQVDFVRAVSERYSSILPVYDIEDLADAIEAARTAGRSQDAPRSHNAEFVAGFTDLVEGLFD